MERPDLEKERKSMDYLELREEVWVLRQYILHLEQQLLVQKRNSKPLVMGPPLYKPKNNDKT